MYVNLHRITGEKGLPADVYKRQVERDELVEELLREYIKNRSWEPEQE